MTEYDGEDQRKPSATPSHVWACGHEGCQKRLACYTETALRILREEHLSTHRLEQRVRTNQAELSYFKDKNPNKLSVSLTDIGFLKTRGIALDDNIELDIALEYQPSKTELPPKQWAEILDLACKRRTE